MKQKYLIALPTIAGGKGFNHPTILKPWVNIGDIKQVNY